MTKKIVVAGDVTIDWLQWSIKSDAEEENKPNWEYYPGYNSKVVEGGAILMAEMLKEALNVYKSGKSVPFQIISQKLKRPLECIPPKEAIHSIAYLDKFEDTKGKSKEVFRVKEFRGFVGPKEELPFHPIVEDDPSADVVVLDDAANGFRNNDNIWPLAIKENKKPLVFYKMSRPLVSGKLWEKLLKPHSDNLVVIVSAKDLRDYGVNISRKLSWERTADDFVWQVSNNPNITDLKTLKHLVVRFGIDGAIYYRFNDGSPEADLYYDPMVFEDGYVERVDGDMQGYGNAFIAAMAAHVINSDLNSIDAGIKNGINSARNLLDNGFGGAKYPEYLLKGIFENNENNIASIQLKMNSSKNKEWTILGSRPKWEIENIASQIVLEGPGSMTASIPVGKFGGLFTVDRLEIEGFQSIRNLMVEYIRKDNDKPLSIAVFGPPGSGKSFGVKQLAKSISNDINDVEFNVSQFNDLSDLTASMHKIRDMVLKGETPLVFFDEFDSSFNGDLGWLKYFLAPMQDGEFKEGETMHPIGKSIFIFAGGTSDTFQIFSREKFPKNTDKNKSKTDFRKAKGTDFVSRLRGYVDILGPNPYGDQDSFYMIRRAILLRSLLERKAKNIFIGKRAKINPGVLSAFMKTPRYKHGVRSMEAIIDMSTLSDSNNYEQSCLPSEKQLEMHVDSKNFNNFVVKDTLFGNGIEKIAIQIHEEYRRTSGKDPSSPSMKPWNDLDEVYKNSNREQAKQIPEKLRTKNYDFMPITTEGKSTFKFSEKEIEDLSVMEHERFVKEKLDNGWKQDSTVKESDPDKKISPWLIDWDDLPENIKEYDRVAIRNIPNILEKAGFEIVSLK